MSNFKEFLKVKWLSLTNKDKQFAIMNAIKTSGDILQGTNVSSSKVIEFAESLLERFYEFEQFQKININASPAKQSLDDKVNQEVETLKDVPF